MPRVGMKSGSSRKNISAYSCLACNDRQCLRCHFSIASGSRRQVRCKGFCGIRLDLAGNSPGLIPNCCSISCATIVRVHTPGSSPPGAELIGAIAPSARLKFPRQATRCISKRMPAFPDSRLFQIIRSAVRNPRAQPTCLLWKRWMTLMNFNHSSYINESFQAAHMLL